MWLVATTVSAWLWISSVDLPCCVADCYYSVCLALDLLGGPPLVCGWLLLQCLPGSASPRWTSPGVWLTLLQCLPGSGSLRRTSPGVWLTATTVSACLWISSVDLPWCVADSATVFAWLWVSSVNLLWCVAGSYYSVCLALDLLGGPPLVCGWLLLQALDLLCEPPLVCC